MLRFIVNVLLILWDKVVFMDIEDVPALGKRSLRRLVSMNPLLLVLLVHGLEDRDFPYSRNLAKLIRDCVYTVVSQLMEEVPESLRDFDELACYEYLRARGFEITTPWETEARRRGLLNRNNQLVGPEAEEEFTKIAGRDQRILECIRRRGKKIRGREPRKQASS